ncbi:MAG: ethanolamine ammonia-lyase light chain EutC [Gammaproteobacteria bacterium]
MQDDQEPAASEQPVTKNPWASLRRFTDARIGLGRSGISIPTQHLLEFQLAHAKAQDAVYKPLDTVDLITQLKAETALCLHEPISLHSAANDRTVYLQRPDFGRRLDDVSRQRFCWITATSTTASADSVIAIVDGLSAFAIEENAVPSSATTLRQRCNRRMIPGSIAPLYSNRTCSHRRHDRGTAGCPLRAGIDW